MECLSEKNVKGVIFISLQICIHKLGLVMAIRSILEIYQDFAQHENKTK